MGTEPWRVEAPYLPLFPLVIALFVFLRLWHADFYSLWLDEVFSVDIASQPWAAFLSNVISDAVHPPLFYALLKIWIDIGGSSLTWLRLFIALTAVAGLWPLLLLIREIGLCSKGAIITLLLVGVNGYLIEYAHELRMYSLVLLLTQFSLWFFLRFIKNPAVSPRVLVLLFAVNLALIYTHYFGWLVVVVEFGYLLLWQRGRILPYGMLVAGLVLGFAPWLLAVASVAAKRDDLGWLGVPHLWDVEYYFAKLEGPLGVSGTIELGIVLFTLPIVLLLAQSWFRKREQPPPAFWLLSIAAFFPVLAVFLASYILPQSVWHDRYLIMAAVPYILLVVFSIDHLSASWIRRILATMVVSWALLSGLHEFTKPNKKVQWDRFTKAMTSAPVPNGSAEIKLYTFEPATFLPMRYSTERQDRKFELVSVKNTEELVGSHFWVLYRDHTWGNDPGPQFVLREKGCRIGEETVSRMRDRSAILFPVWCEQKN